MDSHIITLTAFLDFYKFWKGEELISKYFSPQTGQALGLIPNWAGNKEKITICTSTDCVEITFEELGQIKDYVMHWGNVSEADRLLMLVLIRRNPLDEHDVVSTVAEQLAALTIFHL